MFINNHSETSCQGGCYNHCQVQKLSWQGGPQIRQEAEHGAEEHVQNFHGEEVLCTA